MNSSPNRSSKTRKSAPAEEGQVTEQAMEQPDAPVSTSGPKDSNEAETTTETTTETTAEQTATPPPPAAEAAPPGKESSISDEPSDVASATLRDRSLANGILTLSRDHPIAPPSEPKQYRAIGLVRGRYSPDPEQFTKGMLLTPDGTEIDAVLLGRVMSLLKNHLNLEEDHLWVVYPRTRQQDDSLHVQIMGVWEPETLKQNGIDATDKEAEEAEEIEGENKEATVSQTAVEAESQDDLEEFSEIQEGYFSVRGEVIYQSQEEEYAIIKIKQSPRKGEDKPKFFKLKLEGSLGDRPVNRFWDLHLQLEGRSLVIERGNDIGALFVKSRPPFNKGKQRFSNNRNDSSRSYREGKPRAETASYPKETLPKPVKRQKNPEDN